MCFQSFVHFACGHKEITDRPCELTVDLPFFLKVACPDYHTHRTTPNTACGTGKYYCKQNIDGAFLEEVHRLRDHAKSEITRCRARMPGLKNAWARFHTSADQSGVSQELRKTHPSYHRLNTSQQQLFELLRNATACASLLLQVMTEGFDYHQRRNEFAHHNDVSDFPAFFLCLDLATKLPNELKQHPVAQRSLQFVPGMSGRVLVSEQFINVSENASALHQTPFPRHHAGDDVFVTPRKAMLLTPSPALIEGQPGVAGAKVEKIAQSISPSNKSVHQTRAIDLRRANQAVSPRRRNVASTSKQADLPKEDSMPRRSTRARKRLNYAENENSSDISRGPSPMKSEASSFSPPKSEQDMSPPQREPRRRLGQLKPYPLPPTNYVRDIIGEWNKKGSMNDNPLLNKQLTPANTNVMQSAMVDSNRRLLQPRMPGLMDTTNTSLSGSSHPREATSIPHQVVNTARGGHLLNTLDIRGSGNTGSYYPSGMVNTYSATPGLDGAANLFNAYAAYRSSTAVPMNAPSRIPHLDPPFDGMPYQPTSGHDWLINTPANNRFAQLAAPGQIHRGTYPSTRYPYQLEHRTDSVINTTPTHAPQSIAHRTTGTNDYEQMRRSFSATANLAPPTVQDFVSAVNEPGKREMPSDDLAQPTSKRMRLSLPCENASPSEYGYSLPHVTTSSMSLPRMPSQSVRRQPKVENSSKPAAAMAAASMPASVLAPTAVMYDTSKENYGNEDDGETVDAIVEQADEHTDADDGVDDGEWEALVDDLE